MLGGEKLTTIKDLDGLQKHLTDLRNDGGLEVEIVLKHGKKHPDHPHPLVYVNQLHPPDTLELTPPMTSSRVLNPAPTKIVPVPTTHTANTTTIPAQVISVDNIPMNSIPPNLNPMPNTISEGCSKASGSAGKKSVFDECSPAKEATADNLNAERIKSAAW